MSDENCGWTLREAGVEDCAKLALIGSATFLETFAGTLDGDSIVKQCAREHSEDAYARFLNAGARAWIAEADIGGAPIGFALTASPDLAAARDGDIELKRIYALSRYHGTGLGRALMNVVIETYTDRERLVLGVYAKNTNALGFYARQGFFEIGTRSFDVGGTLYDDKVLARPIEPTKVAER